jgi:stage II sporulation protein D
MRVPSAASVLGAALVVATGLIVAPSGGRGPVAPAVAQVSQLPRVSFTALPGSSILVHGTYPTVRTVCVRHVQPILHARYTGTVEVGKESDGRLFIVEQLPLEDYLKGIAEVPRTWHLEALKAQVVAARSYAMTHIRYGDATGRELGYQLCATDACQVYVGLGVADGPFGQRWRDAVDATAGQVLLYQGRTADALYSSTSNGHTIGNDQVFGSAPLPYLRPVVERDDGASPESHWRVVMPLSDVGRFLHAAGAWPGGAVTGVRRSGSNVVVSGGGTSKSIGVSDFRNDLNSWSGCLDPDTYPTAGGTHGEVLPQTVPSIWFRVATSGGSAVMTGRGWGHGVGLVQWGAEGKAARGLSYRQILAYYYGGLEPQRVTEPTFIRIGITTGLTSVTVAGLGTVISSRPQAGAGPWLVTGGRALRLRHGAAPPSYITAGSLSAPAKVREGIAFNATLSLPQLSVAQVVLRQGRTDVALSPNTTYEPGSATVRARVPAGVPSGTYPIQAVVTNGVDVVRTPFATIRVVGGTAASPSPPQTPSPTPSARPTVRSVAAPAGAPSGWPLAGGVGLAVLAVALGAFVLVREHRRRAGARHAGR